MLKIVFLGTSGSFPTAKRGLPAIAIRRKNELFLFDCGEGTQRRMIQAKVGFKSKMKIFITHLHGDHILGAPGILQTLSLFNRTTPLHVFGPKGLLEFVECIQQTVKFGLTFPLKIHEVDEGIICQEKEFAIYAKKVDHSNPCFAYALEEKQRAGRFYPEKAISLKIPEGPLWSKLQNGFDVRLSDGRIVKTEDVVDPPRRGRKIVYATDTWPCPAVEVLAEGADVLIYEATLDDSLMERASDNYHSTPVQGATVAKRARVQQLILTHISGRYTNTKGFLTKAREIFPNTHIAEDLLELSVPYPD
ncbi:MAG: ribonuclease Z [Candidatus Bathyarchaeota archaeon]|nr:MAG: ribonuclease Z [Candidatus Bathyarchaeota archaeon]